MAIPPLGDGECSHLAVKQGVRAAAPEEGAFSAVQVAHTIMKAPGSVKKYRQLQISASGRRRQGRPAHRHRLAAPIVLLFSAAVWAGEGPGESRFSGLPQTGHAHRFQTLSRWPRYGIVLPTPWRPARMRSRPVFAVQDGPPCRRKSPCRPLSSGGPCDERHIRLTTAPGCRPLCPEPRTAAHRRNR